MIVWELFWKRSQKKTQMALGGIWNFEISSGISRSMLISPAELEINKMERNRIYSLAVFPNGLEGYFFCTNCGSIESNIQKEQLPQSGRY